MTSKKVWLCRVGSDYDGYSVIAVCESQEVALEWLRTERERVILSEKEDYEVRRHTAELEDWKIWDEVGKPEPVTEVIKDDKGGWEFRRGDFDWWDVVERKILTSTSEIHHWRLVKLRSDTSPERINERAKTWNTLPGVIKMKKWMEEVSEDLRKSKRRGA